MDFTQFSKNSFFNKKKNITVNNNLIDLTTPKIMGILNITPDSFYDGSRLKTPEDILKKTEEMLMEGATFIDVGAYSSRPGAENIPEKEELSRLDKALSYIRKKYPDIIISLDTFRPEVADKMINEYNINIINDITGGNAKMYKVIRKYNLPYIMMHMKGTPQDMQKNTQYKDLLEEVISYFSEKTKKAQEEGIKDIIIDPGFGFSKTLKQNYELLKNLHLLNMLGHPVMAGISRKSMIYKLLDTTPSDALNGTTALNTLALMKETDILRVHDVKEAMQTVHLFNEYCSANIKD